MIVGEIPALSAFFFGLALGLALGMMLYRLGR